MVNEPRGRETNPGSSIREKVHETGSGRRDVQGDELAMSGRRKPRKGEKYIDEGKKTVSGEEIKDIKSFTLGPDSLAERSEEATSEVITQVKTVTKKVGKMISAPASGVIRSITGAQEFEGFCNSLIENKDNLETIQLAGITYSVEDTKRLAGILKDCPQLTVNFHLKIRKWI